MSVFPKNNEVIIPENENHWLEMRRWSVTSTEISALFGCNPYITHYELWHRKKGQLNTAFEETDRTRWGKRLEDSIAYGVAEDNGWKIRKKNEYIQNKSLRLGASFDFALNDGGVEGDKALLEIKNVDSLAFRNGWIQHDDGDVECPLHIEFQIQQQMMLAEIDQAYIAALVGGNSTHILYRKLDPEIVGQIKFKSTQFWKSIEEGQAPTPDFNKDADVIKELYSITHKGKAINYTDRARELSLKYSNLNEQISKLEKEKTSVKSELLTILGDAEKMIDDKFTISAAQVMRAGFTVQPTQYRNFRITYKDN